MSNITNSSILYDIEYLIKYLDLSLSAFGIVTNIIHICFLFQNSKIFIFLIFITGADLLNLSTVFFDLVWSIVTYIDHKNCVGYLNYFDMIFKSFVIVFAEFSPNTGAWISVLMCFKWSWNHAKKVATWISGFFFIFSVLYCSIFILILIHILPYSPCSTEDIAQKLMEENEDPSVQVLFILSMLEPLFGLVRVLANLFLLLIWFPLKVYKFWKHRNLDNFYLGNLKLIFSIFLTFCVCDFSRVIISKICYSYGEENPGDLVSQESLNISGELRQIIRTIFASFRPFIVLKVCKNYQEVVKAFFIITGGPINPNKVSPNAPKSSASTTI